MSTTSRPINPQTSKDAQRFINRVHPRRAPKSNPNLLEKDILKACIDYLTGLEARGYLKFVRNNSFAGKITRPNGSQGFVRNNKPGSPDLFIYLKNGQTLHVEAKRPGEEQTENQIAWQKSVEGLGHTYYVVDDLSALVEIIGKHRALTM
jgi:hypothetical protein